MGFLYSLMILFHNTFEFVAEHQNPQLNCAARHPRSIQIENRIDSLLGVSFTPKEQICLSGKIRLKLKGMETEGKHFHDSWF